jgi:DNA mismatch repair protein MutL
MGRIQQLPDDLANQIAAGEVVERPASVVKELVENAIDADATRVHVEIGRGGIDLVRVTDDGEGMDADDAVLALERHATSKIHRTEDLFELRTFGFRGEALPSIASVCKLRLVTRARGATSGTEVVVDGGRRTHVRPAGAPEGTRFEISDLFFNVPARRKFLKSTGTEAAHVTEALQMAALSRPSLTFVLVRDERIVREWLRVATRSDRAAQVFDGERLHPCLGERGPLRIEAHLGAPERARAGAGGLHLLVNGRPVRDRGLARAVAQAYGSVLEVGRYPVGVVYVDLPFEQVDVNVHPQKAEVRFADGRGLLDAVTRELHASLARAFSLPALGTRAWPAGPTHALPSQMPPLQAPPALGWPGSLSERVAEPSPSPAIDPWNLGVAPAPAAFPQDDAPNQSADPFDAPATLFEGVGFYGTLEFLAQVRSTFLLCSGPDGLYVIDQHAAAERVTFHRLRRDYASRAIATQRLLMPQLVEMSPAEVAVVEENFEAMAALGVEARPMGAGAVVVDAIPVLLVRTGPERIVRDLVAELSRMAKRPFGDAADLVLATMACHGSVRAGDTLTREEVAALLAALDGIDFAGHCPHGRPLVTRIGYDELERRVGR